MKKKLSKKNYDFIKLALSRNDWKHIYLNRTTIKCLFDNYVSSINDILELENELEEINKTNILLNLELNKNELDKNLIIQQRKIINHLSRVIQNKNKKYKKLLDKKMPKTLCGREVIIVPDSIAKDIMIVDKKIFENYMEVKND